jgi:hypothetical protein
MPEIRNADFFDTNNCNILSQLMPEEMKSYMRDFINGNLFMNPVGKAMEGINGLMGDNLSILDGLGGAIAGLDSLAADLSAVSLELQAFTDHTNRLSGISVDSVRANFATTFNIMAGFNAMVDTFKNADELLEDNFSKAFSSLDPNITGPFLKDISGNLGKINSVLKEIQRQCAIAGGPAGDACAKLVGSLSSIVNSLKSAAGNITGILNQDNAAFAVALAALERYALGNTLISSALQDPCFSGALAKNLIMNPEGALKLDDVAKKFGKDIPGSRPLLSDYIGGGDDKQVSPLEKGDPAPPTPEPPQLTGSEGTVNLNTSPPVPATEPPPLLAAPPAEDFVSYPDSFPKSTDPEPEEEDFVSAPQEEKEEVQSSESHPDETKITGEEPQKPCGSHIRGDSRSKLLQYVNSYLGMGSANFSGPDDAALLKIAARDIFYSSVVESANFAFRTLPKYTKDPAAVTNYQDKVLKVAEAVIVRGVKVKKKKTSGENWEITNEFLESLVEGDNKNYGLKFLVKEASKDYCVAVGNGGGSFTPFENTYLLYENTATKTLEAFEKDLI